MPHYRKYVPGALHHVYSKGIDGNVIFYSKEDCIWFFTLFSCLRRKYGITVRAFSIMPNHFHSNEEAPSRRDFILFNSRLESEFTVEYNRQHSRSGPLFQSSFGFSPKTVAKKIRDNLSYINNNPVAGGMTDNVIDSKWSLLSFYNNPHPFSEPFALRRASNPMRKAVSLVNYCHKNGKPLNYALQRALFSNLNSDEQAQLTDYIISLYNFLDYQKTAQYYSASMEKAISSFDLNSGSEHDIQEDFEDYSNYLKMMKKVSEQGYDLKTCNFEKITADEALSLCKLFLHEGIPAHQIEKFLHRKIRWSVTP